MYTQRIGCADWLFGGLWLIPAFLPHGFLRDLWGLLHRMGIGILLIRITMQDIRERRISRENSGWLLLFGLLDSVGGKGGGVVPWRSGPYQGVQAALPAVLVLMASFPLGLRGVGGGDLFLVLAGGFLLGPTKGMQALLLGSILALPEAVLQHVRVYKGREADRCIAWGPYLCLGIWLFYLQ